MESNNQQKYMEREKRLLDVIALKEPDRVPVVPLFAFFNCYYSGISPREAYMNPEKALEAWRRTIYDFEPDATYSVNFTIYAMDEVLSGLDFLAMKWPGHGVPDDQSFQFVESEYMKEDEYEELFANPSEFYLRKLLPRLAGNLRGLAKLPPLITATLGYVWPAVLPAFTDPEVQLALETLLNVSKKQAQWVKVYGAFAQELAEAGFPSIKEQTVLAPYDLVADNLRGTTGAATDLLTQPDKLKRAVDQLAPFMSTLGINGARQKKNPRVFIPLHKGTDNFMSVRHFKEFYWPSLQKLIVDLVEGGCNPYLLIEGLYNKRLDIIKDVPPGSCIYHFEGTDIFEAKKQLGDTVCIMGNLPNSLLATGTVDQVKDHTKKLIDVCGDGGGYIMSASALIDQAKPENIAAWMETSREYGRYR
jgi:uroporphyrinogen-III decarboxylase